MLDTPDFFPTEHENVLLKLLLPPPSPLVKCVSLWQYDTNREYYRLTRVSGRSLYQYVVQLKEDAVQPEQISVQPEPNAVQPGPNAVKPEQNAAYSKQNAMQPDSNAVYPEPIAV